MKKLMPIVFFSILICSCGYREGIVQKAEKSYIQFTGNPANAQVQIDDTEPFIIQADEKKLYQLSPGKHQIQIYKNSRLIVNKITYIQGQATMEIDIP